LLDRPRLGWSVPVGAALCSLVDEQKAGAVAGRIEEVAELGVVAPRPAVEHDQRQPVGVPALDDPEACVPHVDEHLVAPSSHGLARPVPGRQQSGGHASGYGPSLPTAPRSAPAASRSCTSSRRPETNAGWVPAVPARANRSPSRSACSAASTSRSKRTSRWSETNPIGETTTLRSPRSASRSRCSPMSGPSHGTLGGPLRDWRAPVQSSIPTAEATSRDASRSWRSYAQPRAIATGIECAVNARCTGSPGGNVASASRTRSAFAWTNPGWL